jgi:hypothetical protein
MKIVDFDGTVLDATFSVQPPDRGVASVVFESSGGHEGGPNPRNLQYRQGLNVLLQRLQRINAGIAELRVETERTRLLPLEQQRVVIPGRTFPVALSAVGDVNEFRKEISRYGRKVGQSPEKAAEGGGSSRRLRIFLTGVPTDQAAIERLLAGEGIEADTDSVAAVVEMAAGRSRGSGQGFLVSQAVRKVVEVYATDRAARYYRSQGWVVADVSASQSYDLRCTRGSEDLHVEVKGTTSSGETLILTRNEVTHAKKSHPNVALFVVTDIRIDGRESDHPVASGGVARVWHNWFPAEEKLTPVGYVYATGLGGTAAPAPWMSVLDLADLELH